MNLPLEDWIFTKREMEVLACLLGRHSSKKIAEILSINPKTVSTYIYNIMDKLECHSRERIIEQIEESALFEPLQKHYFSLILQAEMHQVLKKIYRLNQSNSMCLITQQGHINSNIIYKIQEDLKTAGIKTCFESHKNQAVTHIICIMETFSIKKKYDAEMFKKLKENLQHHVNSQTAFSIFIHTPIPVNLEEKLPYILWGNSYPILFFRLLKRLNLNDSVADLVEKFLKKWEPALQKDPHFIDLEFLRGCEKKDKIIKKNILFSYKFWIIFVNLIGLCGALTFFHWKNYETHYPNKAHFLLPQKQILLARSQLLDDIKEKYACKKNIQSVMLIGIGGTGKTTIAHQYGQTQDHRLIWNVHAENIERVKESFMHLADTLAKTSSEKNEIENIKNTNQNEKKIKKLSNFIRQKLQTMQPWFLVFDNLENFSDIQSFFPSDANIWGKGQILITTRNKHLKNNPYIDPQQIIEVKPLTEEEKKTLFLKIINTKKIKHDQISIDHFLSHIPSFPLDVSITAHYIKNHDVSFKEYLKRLNQGSCDLNQVEMNTLSEVGDYTKTRYGIITSALKELIDTNQDFIKLILMISLIEIDGIPKDLLIECDNQMLVDQLIHHMRKHSLISYEHGKNTKHQASLCVHRSTQEVMFVFLNNILETHHKKYYMDIIIKKIEKHLDSILDRTHTVRMQNLIRHLLQLLKKSKLLDTHQSILVKMQLGRLYYHLGDYLKAQPYFEKGLQYLQQMPTKDFAQIAKILAALGSVARGVGNPQESKNFLEQSLKIYQQYCPDDVTNLAWACLHLGITYTRLGQYENAQELIQKSLSLYKSAYGEKHEKIAACLINMGTLYRICGKWAAAETLYKKGLLIYQELGDKDCSNVKACLATIEKRFGRYKNAVKYLEEACLINAQNAPMGCDALSFNLTLLGDAYQSIGFFKQARETLERALKMRTDCYGENNLLSTQTRVHLAKLLIDMKEYTVAQKLLEYSLKIYQDNFDQYHIRRGWVSYYLNKVHRHLGNLSQARIFLDDSFKVYERHYGKNHLQTARVIRDYGLLYMANGQYAYSEKSLNHARILFEREKHPELYLCLEYLSELYLVKSNAINNKELVKYYKEQAKNYIIKAYKIAKKCFPIHSVHLSRIQEKVLRTQA